MLLEINSQAELPSSHLRQTSIRKLRDLACSPGIDVSVGQARVYVVHLDVIGFTHKLEQFRAVLADIASRPPVPLTLVAGDLNTFGPARPRLWRRIGAAAHAAGLTNLTAGIRRTHASGQKLDAIYALAAQPVRHRAWTLKLRASDHYPVFAELEVV